MDTPEGTEVDEDAMARVVVAERTVEGKSNIKKGTSSVGSQIMSSL